MAAPVLQFKRGLATNVGLASFKAGEPGFTTDKYDFYIGLDATATNQKFFGSARYWKREDATNAAQVKLVDKDGTNFIGIAASNTLSGIATYRLPNTTNGTTGDFLKLKSASGGYYDLEWASVPSGSFTINGDTGTDNFTTGETLTFAGTAKEIETAVTNNQVQIGLPNDVDIANNFKVTGLSTFIGAVTGTISTATRATTVDVTTAPNGVYYPALLNNYATANGYTVYSDAGIYYIAQTDTLYINGNLSVGGTTGTLNVGTLTVKDKDIVLGFTTDANNNDVSTDSTASHGGIAIASTTGSPLFNMPLVGGGINSNPFTYKQFMWIAQGTTGFSGMGTDSWVSNYPIAIGTATVQNNSRFTVGAGYTFYDTYLDATANDLRVRNINAGIITATTFSGTFSGNSTSADQVKTVTAANNAANYYVTFVDSHNGSATAETVYTDDGIYYNPGTNTFTTQYGYFTGNVTVDGTITGTATTATRATLIDTTATSSNADYYVTFVDTLAGQTGETLRVGAGLSINPSTGNVGVSSILSVGSVSAVNAYIKAGGGSNALYLYSNGDVSFQAKAVVNEIRSASDSNTLITLSGLNATFANHVKVTGITTTGTLVLNGTPGVAITAISSSTTLAENSNAYLPTQAAVKAYVDAVDVTTGIAGDTGTGTVNTSQTLTIAGTAGEIETSASSQTITVGLPNDVIVGTSLSAPTVKTATLQHRNGTQAATIDTSGNITASQNLTVTGNLYVNGSTTQVNTTSVTVEDRTLELGLVDGSAPGSTTTWDLGVLFNYYDGSAKKSALVWEQGDARFKLGSVISAGADGTGTSDPQITFSTYAPLEIGGLWVNDCAGQSQVINCTGSTRTLENITIDAGTF